MRRRFTQGSPIVINKGLSALYRNLKREGSDKKIDTQRAKVAQFGYERAEHRAKENAPAFIPFVPTMNQLHRAPELRGIDFDERPADIRELERMRRIHVEPEAGRVVVRDNYDPVSKGIIRKQMEMEHPGMDKKGLTRLYNSMPADEKTRLLEEGRIMKHTAKTAKEAEKKKERAVVVKERAGERANVRGMRKHDVDVKLSTDVGYDERMKEFISRSKLPRKFKTTKQKEKEKKDREQKND